MTDSTQRFISELIRAANETEKLTNLERATLLRRAAGTVRDYRDLITFAGITANDDGQSDVVHDWNEMARLISIFSAQEVSAALLDAAGVIKACRLLLEEHRGK